MNHVRGDDYGFSLWPILGHLRLAMGPWKFPASCAASDPDSEEEVSISYQAEYQLRLICRNCTLRGNARKGKSQCLRCSAHVLDGQKVSVSHRCLDGVVPGWVHLFAEDEVKRDPRGR